MIDKTYTKIIFKNNTKKRLGDCHVKVMYNSCTFNVELGQVEVRFRYGSD